MSDETKADTSERNKTYRRNHRNIQKVFIKLNRAHRWHITLKQIMSGTKLSKRTLLAHYPDLDNALSKIEQELLQGFDLEIKKSKTQLAQKITPDNNRRYFFAVMFYMAQNKDVFVPVCEDIANHTVLYKMMERIYPLLEITWFPLSSPPPEIGDERANVFCDISVGILKRWGHETRCDTGESEEFLSKLLRLTQEASARCK